MKRIATITENGNAQMDIVSPYGVCERIDPTAVIGPIDRVELLSNKFLITATNGCSVWADEIRREE